MRRARATRVLAPLCLSPRLRRRRARRRRRRHPCRRHRRRHRATHAARVARPLPNAPRRPRVIGMDGCGPGAMVPSVVRRRRRLRRLRRGRRRVAPPPLSSSCAAAATAIVAQLPHPPRRTTSYLCRKQLYDMNEITSTPHYLNVSHNIVGSRKYFIHII